VSVRMEVALVLIDRHPDDAFEILKKSMNYSGVIKALGNLLEESSEEVFRNVSAEGLDSYLLYLDFCAGYFKGLDRIHFLRDEFSILYSHLTKDRNLIYTAYGDMDGDLLHKYSMKLDARKIVLVNMLLIEFMIITPFNRKY